jgi:hypothetical protein
VLSADEFRTRAVRKRSLPQHLPLAHSWS